MLREISCVGIAFLIFTILALTEVEGSIKYNIIGLIFLYSVIIIMMIITSEPVSNKRRRKNSLYKQEVLK